MKLFLSSSLRRPWRLLSSRSFKAGCSEKTKPYDKEKRTGLTEKTKYCLYLNKRGGSWWWWCLYCSFANNCHILKPFSRLMTWLDSIFVSLFEYCFQFVSLNALPFNVAGKPFNYYNCHYTAKSPWKGRFSQLQDDNNNSNKSMKLRHWAQRKINNTPRQKWKTKESNGKTLRRILLINWFGYDN